MSLKERIKQVLDADLEYCAVHRKNNLFLRLTKARKEVLQILKDSKIIPMEKWRELLKLLQTQPHLEGKSTLSKFIEYHGENEEWRTKIEKKLEEIEKC